MAQTLTLESITNFRGHVVHRPKMPRITGVKLSGGDVILGRGY